MAFLAEITCGKSSVDLIRYSLSNFFTDALGAGARKLLTQAAAGDLVPGGYHITSDLVPGVPNHCDTALAIRSR